MDIKLNDIVTIVPAFNEEKVIERDIIDLRKHGLNNIIVSIDPKTTDNTIRVLTRLNVKYVHSATTGYDWAMMTGVNAIDKYYPQTKAVLFSGTGGKNGYKYINSFIQILNGGADMALGTRETKTQSMLWHQKLGTKFVLFPINILMQSKIKDISPFRLVKYDFLKSLNMQPSKFRWTTEMLVKALSIKGNIQQMHVSTNKRKGRSKISGSIKNTILAAFEMLSAIKFIRYGKHKLNN